jgi:hypothetical protein
MAKPNTPAVTKQDTKMTAATDNGLMLFDQQETPDYIKNEQRGSENVGVEDIIIPRLEIIQALSPQVKRGDAKYIDAAKPGMLVNSVSQELYGESVVVIPIVYQKQWLVWGRRKYIDESGREQKSEGGFFGAFNSPEEAKDRVESEVKDNGTNPRSLEVLDTPSHLCLLLNFGTGKTEEVMVSMPRTKAKVSRQWNSLVRMAGGDRFSRAYKVSAVMEKNKQGDDYINFNVTQLGFPSKAVYEKAEGLYKQMQAGRAVTMDVSEYNTVESEAGADSEM